MTSIAEPSSEPPMRTWPGFVALSITLALMVATLLLFQAEDRRGLVAVALLAGVGAFVAIILQGLPGDSAAWRNRQASADARKMSADLAVQARRLASADVARRLDAVAAIGELADAWPVGRQRCIDTLCNHLRRTPADAGPVVRLIAAHLRRTGPTTWQGYDLDFSGANLSSVSFARTVFAGATFSFSGTRFAGQIAFDGARFCDAKVDFTGATFQDAGVDFSYAIFSDAALDLRGARLETSQIDFFAAALAGTTIDLRKVTVGAASTIRFARSQFTNGSLRVGAEVRACVDLSEVRVIDVRIKGIELPSATERSTAWQGPDRRAM